MAMEAQLLIEEELEAFCVWYRSVETFPLLAEKGNN